MGAANMVLQLPWSLMSRVFGGLGLMPRRRKEFCIAHGVSSIIFAAVHVH